jgi:hypothetical protein
MLGGDGFRVDPLGTAARCLEVRGYAPTETKARIVCWNFAANRTLNVNGAKVECIQNEGVLLTKKRADGYCVQVGAGQGTDAGILLPIR